MGDDAQHRQQEDGEPEAATPRSPRASKRTWLACAFITAWLAGQFGVSSQISRSRHLDINSGATKRTVEVLGIRVSSSQGLDPVHVVPGLQAEWRWAGQTKGGRITCGAYGRAAVDYRAIDFALTDLEVDASTREEVFANWRDHLRDGYFEHLEFIYASEDEADDWPPVAARVENDHGQWIMIFDFRQ